MHYRVYMEEQPWGRRKQEVVITIQGLLTEKQYEEVERRIFKIIEKFDMGFAASDEFGVTMY